MDFLESLRPSLCSDVRRIIERVLEKILEPADQLAPPSASDMPFDFGMAGELPAFDDFYNFDLLDTFDWVNPMPSVP